MAIGSWQLANSYKAQIPSYSFYFCRDFSQALAYFQLT